jgi:hypothetical protein
MALSTVELDGALFKAKAPALFVALSALTHSTDSTDSFCSQTRNFT